MLMASLPNMRIFSTRQFLARCFILSSAAASAVFLIANQLMAQTLASTAAAPPALKWEQLPPIPDSRGLGYPFGGVSNGALVIGGGSNFPDKPIWENGTKVWYDSVFVLEQPTGQWKTGGKLPRALAGGVSVTTSDGVACLGGGDADRNYADCFLLQWQDGKLETKSLPKLPRPCANFAGVLVGSTIYAAGGIEHTNDSSTLKTFWSLDLTNRPAGWQILEPWPGPGRMLATIGAQDGAIYLFGGADLKPSQSAGGKPERAWLKDAYQYTPGKGWKQIADLPRVAVAAPSPAPSFGKSRLLILGGDDGAQAALPLQTHKGFPRDVLAYDTTNNTWSVLGELPFSLVTTPAVTWRGHIVIPGGEARPGVRSKEVWSAMEIAR
jgi:N-acetylneuraminate epimerase